MTSRHYRWQTRWTVDAAALEARHESGLVVRFTRAGPSLRAELVNRAETVAALTPKNGAHNAPRMVDRMEREAVQLMGEALGGQRS